MKITNTTDLNVLNGILGFKFFKEEKYAKDFQSGKFRTMPLSYYSKQEHSNQPFYDPNEGVCSYVIPIDIKKEIQKIHYLDGSENIFLAKAAEDEANKSGYSIKDSYLVYEKNLNCHVFCFAWSYFEDVENLFSQSDVVQDLTKFGKYCVAFSIRDFFDACLKNNDIILGSNVIYKDGLSNHFSIKKTCYKNEHEFRFLFKNTEENAVFHETKPIKTILFKF